MKSEQNRPDSGGDRQLLCPSGRLEAGDSRVFGILSGSAEQPRVHYLPKTLPLDQELLGQTQAITPTEVFRIASNCDEKQCAHFDGHQCQLVLRVVDQFPEAADTLPACAIRRDCRWWKQSGKAACLRCPQIITDNYHPSDLEKQVATPHNQQTNTGD
jgi:hypothetical protein